MLRRDNKAEHGKYADFWKKRLSKGSELALALAPGPNEMTSSVWFGRVAETYQHGSHGKATIVKLESSHAGDPLPGEVLDPETGKLRKDPNFMSFDASVVMLDQNEGGNEDGVIRQKVGKSKDEVSADVRTVSQAMRGE